MEKYKIALPIAVEGKYDKNTLLQIFDATVITVDGFAVFNSKEKQLLLRRLAVNGIIILTDSDGGGKQIRSFISGIIPKERIFNVYIPAVAGKERRKDKPSRAGLLGVEGMDRDTLVRVLSPFIIRDPKEQNAVTRVTLNGKMPQEIITKVDFYNDGLSGSDNASDRRAALALYFELPPDMTANALLAALNIITDKEGYRAAVLELFQGN